MFSVQKMTSPAGGGRKSRRLRAMFAVLIGAALVAGCNEDEALRAFRDAAADGLQAGSSSIATGLIDGAFAIFRLGPNGNGGDGIPG